MKGIVRGQSSARPFEAVGKTIKKAKKRGGVASKPHKGQVTTDSYVTKGHDNRQMRTVLAKMTAKEQRRLSLRASGKAMREREQLVNLGKMERKPCVKRDENVPECWAHLVPAGVDFTVEGLLLAMVKEEMKPLYSSDGSAAA